MSAPFMQLYVADYLGDTRHLTTEQHGAYLLLLMTMWRSGGVLSSDPAKLARIAGLTVARWNRISDEVLEFFTPCEGGITQARLAAELTIADEKSEKRAQAGRAGGRAKALKEHKSGVANAMRLPCHSPEPEPERKPPTPLGRKARTDPHPLSESLWAAQPQTGGKRKTTRPDVDDAFRAALARGADPQAILAAFKAYYALPDCRKEEGRFSMGAKVLLAKDRWREFLPTLEPPVKLDPAFIEDRKRHYRATGEWQDAWGQRPAA